MSEIIGKRLGRQATALAPLVIVILAATNYVVWNLTAYQSGTVITSRRAVIKKIFWYNNGAGVVTLQFGYLNLGAAFVQCLPSIATVSNFDGQLTEDEIPLCGNAKEGGFVRDDTLVTGTLGNIIVQATGAGIAAGVQVQIEVEER